MSEETTPEPAGVWAVVELMGRVRYAGRLSEVERYGGKLARIDIPQADDTFVTKFFGAAAVYTITFVTEQVARAVKHQSDPAPVQPWDFPTALNSPAEPLAPAPPGGGSRYDDPNLDDDDLNDEESRGFD